MAKNIAIGEVSRTKIREMMGNVIPESTKGTKCYNKHAGLYFLSDKNILT